MHHRSLTIDNNEFTLGSACVSSENYWDRKIIENLLLRFYFKVLSRQTEMIHQRQVGRLSHAVTECALGEWCQRLPLAFVLQEDILSTCWNEDDVMWHVCICVFACVHCVEAVYPTQGCQLAPLQVSFLDKNIAPKKVPSRAICS